MVRKAKPQPSMARMYRHFAAVTIAVTGAIAVFADGEAVKTVEEHAAQKREERRIADANQARFGDRRLIRRDPHAQSGGGSFGPNMTVGSPSVVPRSGGGSVSYSRVAEAPQQEIWDRLGLSKEEWDDLSSDLQRQLAQSIGEDQAAPSAAEQRLAVRRLSSGSRSRSGDSGQSSDARY